MSDAPEVRVAIRRLGQRFFVITRHADGREICTNEFQVDPADFSPAEPLGLVDRSRLAVQQRSERLSRVEAVEAQVIASGRKLYRYLFGDARDLQAFLDALPAPRSVRLSLLLHPEIANLWYLPWEYIHDGRAFLCLDGAFSLSRRPAASDGAIPLPRPAPLRILFAMPQPLDRVASDAARELELTQSALAEGIREERVVLDVLDDASLPALADVLQQGGYHVLHYAGHGAANQGQQRGFLCFEDQEGRTELVSAEQICALAEGTGVALIVLSAALGARTGAPEAFSRVAPALLHAGIPAVLILGSGLVADSTTAIFRALYMELANGQPLLDSVHAARAAAWAIDVQRKPDERTFDWGVPALYLSSTALCLVDLALARQDSAAGFERWRTGFPMIPPHPFVGRHKELRTLRAGLREAVTVLAIWGGHGAGKTALVAQALRAPSILPVDVHVIRCQETYQPEDVIDSLIHFWLARDTPEHRQAAGLLANSSLPPYARAQQAQQLLSAHRHIVVLDDLDAILGPSCSEASTKLLTAILLGLFAGRGRTTYILTGNARCVDLASLPIKERVEIQLPLLSQQHVLQLLNSVPRFRTLSSEDKTKLYWQLGGNPQVLALASGWIAAGHSANDLLLLPALEDHLSESWAGYFTGAILDSLSMSETEALTALALLHSPICAALLPKVTRIADSHAASMLHRWSELGLLEPHHADSDGNLWYSLHIWVREDLMAHISPEEEVQLHTSAAAYYGAPFIDETRRLLLQYGHVVWSEDMIGRLARHANGVLGQALRQPGNPDATHRAIRRVLAWQFHLLKAGETDAAIDLTRALIPALKHWGARDLARGLLRGYIEALQHTNRYQTLVELGGLEEEEGRLGHALQVYQETHAYLAAQGSQAQMAYICLRIADVQQRLGELEAALQAGESALQLMRETGDRQGELASLGRLCQLYWLLGRNQQALVHSQITRELASQLRDPAGLMSAIQEQGRIFSQMEHQEHALSCWRDCLEISRRLGAEQSTAEQLQEIARIEQELGRPDAALASLQQAMDIHERGGQTELLAAVLRSIGEIHEQQGRLAEALESYERAGRPTTAP